MVGGSSPVASRQAADSPLCAAVAASTAEAVPMIFHARDPTFVLLLARPCCSSCPILPPPHPHPRLRGDHAIRVDHVTEPSQDQRRLHDHQGGGGGHSRSISQCTAGRST